MKTRTPHKPAIVPLRAAIRHALFCLGMGLATLNPVHAAEVANAVTFSIPAGSLDSTLQQFSRASGVNISFDASTLAGKNSPGLGGTYAPEAALNHLLGGSGLRAIPLSSGGYQLIASTNENGALTLDATSIQASGLQRKATTEGTGSYTTGSTNTATKMNLSIRETPQSITVITRQRMDDQGMNSLTDAVKSTPGLTVQKWASERTTFFSRGFQVDNIMYDGLPTIVSRYTPDMSSSVDLAIYDRVEVVRGASGLMQGTGNPSAAINLIRKRPTKDTHVSLSSSAGSWDNYRSELDASSSLNESGSLRGRTVLSYQDKNSFQDVVGAKRVLLYAVAEADMNENTTFTLGASRQKDDSSNDWGGVPTAPNGSDLHLSRSTFVGNDWAYWDSINTAAFAELEHRLDNGWKLRLAANHSWSELEFLGSYVSWDNTGSLNQYTGNYVYEENQKSYDLYASGPFTFAGREHDLIVGASKRQQDFGGHGGSGQTASNMDPGNWDSGVVAKPRYNMYTFHQKFESEQESAYISTRINPSDTLKVILGMRLDWYDYDVQTLSSNSHSGYSLDQELTHYAGIVYDIDSNHSVYASYTDIFKPQSSLDAKDKVLDPVEGKNYELGIKGEYFDGALNSSAAIFRIDQQNRAKTLPRSQCSSPLRACYEAAGEVRSEGVELEVNGKLSENWQLAAGYTYTETKYRKDSVQANEGEVLDPKIPRHLFKLTTSYQLPDDLSRWRVGGSLYKQSSFYSADTHWRDNVAYRIEQEGYTLLDVMLSYRATENLLARVTVNNLFDKKYFQSIDTGAQERSVVYGDPRNLSLAVKYDF